MSFYDGNLLQQMKDKNSASLKIHSLSSIECYSLLKAKFPIKHSKIDWNEINSKKGVNNEQGSYNKVAQFLISLKESKFIKIDNLIYTGDNLDNAYQVTWVDFYKNLGIFLSIPQDSYLFPYNCEWCFSYTFEDEFFWGES